MILRELGAYLAAHQQVSRRELARHFHTSEDAIEAMLGVWMRKGMVIKRTRSACGGRCCGSSNSEEVIFAWCALGQIGFNAC
ncbi:FeoC-like transcriptional regulator [Aeromonas cavernicola]|uniref:LuxR family transcriptional regulator n=1 Tax=Aeromonas cavernicola TaxID=1006623 RepID=A0A2H9U0I3_9GAMM|nr:FeoC-like transcriptional regulator [Aeromonas cavernicola]PJG57458.1 LuxR family transcriptional regulator [Aeromonas cavernicola]